MTEDAVVDAQDMPFVHHVTHRNRHPNPKFKSPRKRASRLLEEIQREETQRIREDKPQVFEEDFRVGDAIELQMVQQGNAHGQSPPDKIRGLVIGRVNRGLGSSIYLRDVVFGEPVEYKVPLYSPLVRSLRVLERNFLFKGRRKVKRAKLYYLRDRSPNEYRVTKW